MPVLHPLQTICRSLSRDQSVISGCFANTVLHLEILFLLFPSAAVKSLQSYPTLWDPIDRRPPGSPIPGILQARTLEWVAISFSNAWKWRVKGKSLRHVWLLVTLWTAAYQAPPPMGFSRQEYWSGVYLIRHVRNWGTERLSNLPED